MRLPHVAGMVRKALFERSVDKYLKNIGHGQIGIQALGAMNIHRAASGGYSNPLPRCVHNKLLFIDAMAGIIKMVGQAGAILSLHQDWLEKPLAACRPRDEECRLLIMVRSFLFGLACNGMKMNHLCKNRFESLDVSGEFSQKTCNLRNHDYDVARDQPV